MAFHAPSSHLPIIFHPPFPLSHLQPPFLSPLCLPLKFPPVRSSRYFKTLSHERFLKRVWVHRGTFHTMRYTHVQRNTNSKQKKNASVLPDARILAGYDWRYEFSHERFCARARKSRCRSDHRSQLSERPHIPSRGCGHNPGV